MGEAKEPLTKEMLEAMAAKKYWTSPGGKTPAGAPARARGRPRGIGLRQGIGHRGLSPRNGFREFRRDRQDGLRRQSVPVRRHDANVSTIAYSGRFRYYRAVMTVHDQQVGTISKGRTLHRIRSQAEPAYGA